VCERMIASMTYFTKLLLSTPTSCGVNVRMSGQWRLGENLKRILHDLILILSRNLPSGNDKSHTHLSEELVFRQRHELGTFRIQVDTPPCSVRVILKCVLEKQSMKSGLD